MDPEEFISKPEFIKAVMIEYCIEAPMIESWEMKQSIKRTERQTEQKRKPKSNRNT